MFPLQPKFASLFDQQKQQPKLNEKQHQSYKSKENSLKSINKENSIKALKKNKSIYLCTKQKKRKNCPLLKIFNPRELRGGLDYRHEISNHGLAMLFLKLNTCLLSYSHPSQPKQVEGTQAECQSQNQPFLRYDVLT